MENVVYFIDKVCIGRGEKITPLPCLADTPNKCERQQQCTTLAFWSGLDKVVREYIDCYTLADLKTY